MAAEGISNTLSSATRGAKTFWQNQDASRRRLIVIVAVASIVLLSVLVWITSSTQYAVLYANLTPQDAGEILQELENRGVNAKAEGTDTILVDESEVDGLRMDLAAAGFPKSSTNLDILQQGSGFGITEEDKAVYRRYQLQEDLQNAIKTFDNVIDARVTLTIPRESSFLIESQQVPATAAVLLTLDPGTDMAPGNVKAISELVQKSVPNLQPSGVTIIDSNMHVLSAENGAEESLTAHDRQAMEREVSERLKSQIMALLQPVFGMGNVLAEVSVGLDFDESVVETIRFEPAEGMSSGLIASIEEIREVAAREGVGAGEPGTAENGAGVPIYPVVDTEDSVYEKNSQRINYEINTIQEQIVRAQGDISQLSVSVVLDSNAIDGLDYGDNVRQLVATAVGVSDEHITVDALPFRAGESLDDAFSDYTSIQERALQLEQLRFYIILGAIAFLSLIIFFSLLRLVRGRRRSREEEAAQAFPSLAPEQRASQALESAQHEEEGDETTLKKPEEIKERKAINGYINENPELVAGILKSWLAED